MLDLIYWDRGTISDLQENSKKKKKKDTYCYNEEIQPTPGIREEFHKSIGTPLQQHFKDKDVGEDFVSILQDGAYCFSLFYINILKGLRNKRTVIVIIS